jgi:exonuclease SbcC
VWTLRERVEELERRTRDAEQALAAAAHGYETWLRDDEQLRLEASLQEMLNEAGVTNATALDERLSRAVQDAEEVAERLRNTRSVAMKIADELQDQADKYAQSVLEPLSATIQSYSRALMSSGEDSLYYRARFRANRSELKPGIVQRMSSGDKVTRDMDPNLFFSEGQLSALSVSSMLAASTTFQWSRWPALLMDDPLQHNDVIHASAFIDLLRRLVQKLGYQAILSTHDSDEAEFIVRKCESARVPFSVCELRPSGGRGLVSG